MPRLFHLLESNNAADPGAFTQPPTASWSALRCSKLPHHVRHRPRHSVHHCVVHGRPSGMALSEAPMNFQLTEDQLAVKAAIEKVCAPYGDDFWLARDRDGRFPHEFHQAMARD